MPAVLFLKLFIGQVRNRLRIAAAVETVASVRKELAHDLPVDQGIRIAHGAFHFIINNTLVNRVSFLIPVYMPALLAETFPVLHHRRGEHRIQIYTGQIQQVPRVPAGNGKHRHILKSHRVQESIHTALQQFHKRFPNRILFAPAKHTVFQNMENARIILRQGPERNGKHHIFRPVIHPEQACTGFQMLHEHCSPPQLAACPDFPDDKAENLLILIKSHLYISLLKSLFSDFLIVSVSLHLSRF